MAINWTELKDLHVISKVRELISQWYGAEIFHRPVRHVQSGNWAKDFEYKNQFLAVLNQTSQGFQTLGSDFENFFDTNRDDGFCVSSFDGVSFFGQSIQIDGEPVGGVFAFPVVKGSISDEFKTY